MIAVHGDIDGHASVSFNSLACQNFGIESYITAKANGLRFDLKVVRVWQYNDMECTCLMVISLWWCRYIS